MKKGEIKDRIGEIGYNNKGEKMIIVAYRGYNDIDIKFEDNTISYNKQYDNFKIGNIKHPIRYEESFAYHIEVELGLNLDDIWNWDKNNENDINPYKLKKQSNKKVWLYCLKHDYHNYDREGNKVGYKTSCDRFFKGYKCSYCGKNKTHWKDSLAYNYPQIARMIAIKENDLTFDDCYNIACKTHKKFYFKCSKCNIVSNKKYSLYQIVTYGYPCKVCSDGIPVTEKFITNILKQLNVDYIYQLNKSDFEWCKDFRYDFYISNLNIIIETHGEQHYKETYSKWDNLEDIQMNDLFKYKCAKNHINNYIIIDCRYSTLKWLKENIIKELSNYFDLSNIDWELAWEESQNSLCVKSWELWNSGIHSTVEIGKILNINRNTVTRYLKRGVECEKCNYSKNGLTRNNFGKNHYKSKRVICITTKRIFNTISDACSYYGIKGSNIGKCCMGKRKTCKGLKWRYINIHHNKVLRGENINKLHIGE